MPGVEAVPGHGLGTDPAGEEGQVSPRGGGSARTQALEDFSLYPSGVGAAGSL